MVDILFGPTVNITDTTVPGDELRLICTVQSNPEPTSLKWYKPDGSSLQGGELVISKFQRNQNGVYTCEAMSTLVPTDGRSITRYANESTFVTLCKYHLSLLFYRITGSHPPN
ncbi:hypothetical protein SNE40_020667 [Patella caerulea]|uniref:Ig-like domain-containing protein n=1 Tax=Patella caerulea TaxID=87958 RepID=A0AAN8PG32_PATCE